MTTHHRPSARSVSDARPTHRRTRTGSTTQPPGAAPAASSYRCQIGGNARAWTADARPGCAMPCTISVRPSTPGAMHRLQDAPTAQALLDDTTATPASLPAVGCRGHRRNPVSRPRRTVVGRKGTRQPGCQATSAAQQNQHDKDPEQHPPPALPGWPRRQRFSIPGTLRLSNPAALQPILTAGSRLHTAHQSSTTTLAQCATARGGSRCPHLGCERHLCAIQHRMSTKPCTTTAGPSTRLPLLP